MKHSIILCALCLMTLLQACKSKNHNEPLENVQASSQYLEKGKEITTATFKVLSSNLQQSIKKGGIQEAISYCNLNASPLVDSLSKEYNATMRRTSFKVRNSSNEASLIEKHYLDYFSKKIDSGEILDPVLYEGEQSVSYFAPIVINNFCLQCHGHPGKTLPESNYRFIKEHYPMDEAIGYNDGDLRGIWSIRFSKSD